MNTEQKRSRHKQFFQPLEKGEGGYLAVISPINDSGKPPIAVSPPQSLEEKWLSTEYLIKTAEASAQNIFWGQDAIHNVFVNMGPGVQAAMLGAPYRLANDSIWFDTDPPLKDYCSPLTLVTNKNHPLYKAIDSHTRGLCAASKGRYTVSITDIGGQLDVLFSLRGEDLLTDFIEYPDEVLATEAKLDEEFLRYFNELTSIIGPTGCGHSSWMQLVNDTPYAPIQCDVSVMLSPAMFEKFVMPSLDKVSTVIGTAIYHLDGPEGVPHLDMVLSLKHVHAIQWVPLPYHASDGSISFNYADEISLDIYRRTKAAGKKVVLSNVNPRSNQIETIFDAVGCDGVFMYTQCHTRKEADELIAYAHKQKWIAV